MNALTFWPRSQTVSTVRRLPDVIRRVDGWSKRHCRKTRHDVESTFDMKMKLVILILLALRAGCPAPDAIRQQNQGVIPQPISQAKPTIRVFGEVRYEGTYPFTTNTDLFGALDTAGGLTDYAGDAVYIRRRGQILLPVSLSNMKKGKAGVPRIEAADEIEVSKD